MKFYFIIIVLVIRQLHSYILFYSGDPAVPHVHVCPNGGPNVGCTQYLTEQSDHGIKSLCKFGSSMKIRT